MTYVFMVNFNMRVKVRKEDLEKQMRIEQLLVSKLSFQLNTKTNLHFVGVTTKPKNLLRKHIQTEKPRNCVYLLLLVYKTDVK